MALADIVVNDSQSTPVAHTYTFISYDKNGRVVRGDLSRTPDLPLTLTVGHKKIKKNGVLVDAHVVDLSNALIDADGITVRNITYRCTAEIDPAVYTDAISDDMITMLHNVMTEVFTRAWARGSAG